MMRWRESLRRTGAWLGFVSLLLRFALAFGDVHLEWYGGGPFGSVLAAPSEKTEGAPNDPGAPPPHDPDTCSICWTLSLAGALVLPSVPQLAPPELARARSPTLAVDLCLARDSQSNVRSRAPPIA